MNYSSRKTTMQLGVIQVRFRYGQRAIHPDTRHAREVPQKITLVNLGVYNSVDMVWITLVISMLVTCG